MSDEYIYISPYIKFRENKLENVVTGNVFSGNRENMDLLKFIKENEPIELNELHRNFLFSDESVKYLLDNGIFVHDKNNPNAEITVENALVTEYDTFFNLKRGNLIDDLSKKKRIVGIIGIDAPTSSYIYNIDKKAYEVLRNKSKDIMDLSMCNFLAKDYGILLNPLIQELSFKWLADIGCLLLGSNIIPIFVGGDHGITYHLLQKFLKTSSNLSILQIDAHRDMGFRRSKYPEHGSFIKDLIAKSNNVKVYQYGIRDMDIGCYEDNIDKVDIIENISDVEGDDLYITIDVDAFSYADIPAVNYPLPNGLKIQDFLQDVQKISCKRVIGCDIVEYNSQFDIGNNLGAVGVNYILLGLIKWLLNN